MLTSDPSHASSHVFSNKPPRKLDRCQATLAVAAYAVSAQRQRAVASVRKKRRPVETRFFSLCHKVSVPFCRVLRWILYARANRVTRLLKLPKEGLLKAAASFDLNDLK